MPKRISEFEHSAILEMLGNILYAQNRNPNAEKLTEIKVDIGGFHLPERIDWPDGREGEVPDATAIGSKFYIYEVETADSITDEHTERQWALFAGHAKERGGVFYVVVPPMNVMDARRRMKELSLDGQVMPVP